MKIKINTKLDDAELAMLNDICNYVGAKDIKDTIQCCYECGVATILQQMMFEQAQKDSKKKYVWELKEKEIEDVKTR